MRIATAVVAALLVAGIVGGFLYLRPATDTSLPGEEKTTVALSQQTAPRAMLPKEYATPGQTTYYRDDVRKFYFQMPKGFVVNAISEDTNTLIIADAKGNGAISIAFLPASADDINLTAEQIKQAAPNIVMQNTKTVSPAPKCGGVSFDGNNDNFDGASHEIWFICRGTLYQLSAARSAGALLEALFSTWTFQP